MRTIRAQLERIVSHHLSGWIRCLLSWRPRWKCYTTPLECKQPENVLLLIKFSLVIFSFITLYAALPIIYLNIKQNLGHTWLLRPYTLSKLIFSDIFLSVKQNLSYAWSLGSHVLDKLILNDVFLSVKENLSYAWSLGSHVLGKLILIGIFLSVKQNLSYAWSLGPHALGKLILNYIFLSVKHSQTTCLG